MSYLSINECANDGVFQGRVSACCATQGRVDVAAAMAAVIWPVCSAADIEAAYEAALVADNPDPGGDPAVVTDQMILSAVQAHLPAPDGTT